MPSMSAQRQPEEGGKLCHRGQLLHLGCRVEADSCKRVCRSCLAILETCDLVMPAERCRLIEKMVGTVSSGRNYYQTWCGCPLSIYSPFVSPPSVSHPPLSHTAGPPTASMCPECGSSHFSARPTRWSFSHRRRPPNCARRQYRCYLFEAMSPPCASVLAPSPSARSSILHTALGSRGKSASYTGGRMRRAVAWLLRSV